MRWLSPSLNIQRPRMRAHALIASGLVSAGALLAAAAPADAATHTWIGPMAGTWSNAANWSGGVPGTDSTESRPINVVFNGNTLSNMDISRVYDSVQLLGNNNVIGGGSANSMTLAGSFEASTILSTGTGNALLSGLQIGTVGSAGIRVKSSNGVLAFGASIDGSAPLSFSSDDVSATPTAGTQLTGNNTYSGEMSVNAGLLSLNAGVLNSAVRATTLTATVKGVVRFQQGAQIADTTTLVATAGGQIDLNDQTDLVASLVVTSGGKAALGTGRLGTISAVTADDARIEVDTGTLAVGGLLTVAGGVIDGATGSVINLGGDVRFIPVGSTPVIVRPNVTLNGNRTVVVDPGDAGSVINGNVLEGTGGPNALRKEGAGELSLSNPNAANTYSGGTTIVDGRLTVDFDTMVPAGTVRVGDGTGASESAVLDVDDEAAVSLSANVVVAADGLYRYTRASSSPRLASLTISGGRVTGVATSDLGVGSLAFAGGSVDAFSKVDAGTSLSGQGTVAVPLSANGVVAPTGTGLQAKTLALGASTRLRTTVDGTTASPVTSLGPVTIASGAQIELARAAGSLTPPGTAIPVLAVVPSSAADRITGVFGNLANGGTINAGSLPLTANYAAGAGANDLVLTAGVDPGAAKPTTPSPTTPPATTPPATTPPATTPPATTPTGDLVAPVLKLAAAPSQRFKTARSKLSARITSNEAGRATIVVSIKLPGAKRAFTASTTAKLTAGKGRALSLALPLKARIPARSALRRGKRVTVKVVVTARDDAGNRSKAATKTITLKR